MTRKRKRGCSYILAQVPIPAQIPDVGSVSPPPSGAMPLCCGLLDVHVEAGYKLGQYVRCNREIEVNTGVMDRMRDQQLPVEPVCLMCWSSADQDRVRGYRGNRPRARS